MSKLEPSPSKNQIFDQAWINWLAKVYRYFAKPGTAEPEKAVVLDANSKIDALDITALSLNGTAIAATATEVDYNAGVTPGTVSASKTVVVDANKDIAGFRYISFGGQLAFPATQAASSNANTLDDYEEGTWTPIISDLTNNASAYSIQYGAYVKLAETVYIKAFVNTTNIGSVTGSVYISGLPFTSNATANSQQAIHIGYGVGLSITAGYNMSGGIAGGTSYIILRLWNSASGTSSMQHTEWTNTGGCIISGFYNT